MFLFPIKDQVLFFFSLAFLLVYVLAVLGFSLLHGIHIGVASLVANLWTQGHEDWWLLGTGAHLLGSGIEPISCVGGGFSALIHQGSQGAVSNRQPLDTKGLTKGGYQNRALSSG